MTLIGAVSFGDFQYARWNVVGLGLSMAGAIWYATRAAIKARSLPPPLPVGLLWGRNPYLVVEPYFVGPQQPTASWSSIHVVAMVLFPAAASSCMARVKKSASCREGVA